MTAPERALWVAHEVGSKEFVDTLVVAGVNAKKTTLDSGDFCWEGHGPDGPLQVGVERKTLTDLCDCLRDGRLTGAPTEHGKGGQLHRLLRTYDVVWLLVEGRWKVDANGRLYTSRGPAGKRLYLPGGFTEDSLTKHLMTIEMQHGVHIASTESKHQTAAWLASHFRWWTDKTWDQHGTSVAVHVRHKSIMPISTFREMMLPLPGLGLAGTKALEKLCEEKLGRLRDLTVSELTSMQLSTPRGPRKFGEAKARELHNALQKLR